MIRTFCLVLALLIFSNVSITAARAQQCDDAQFAREFEERFGASRQAGMDTCGAIALQLEALTYMKGMQRACFSGSDLQALLADADRTIAQSQHSYRDNSCGEPPGFQERALDASPAQSYRMEGYTMGALTPCPPQMERPLRHIRPAY